MLHSAYRSGKVQRIGIYRALTLQNWTGVVYRIPRTDLDRCKDRDDLSQSGVYFLFGVTEDTDEDAVYVGQAGVRKNGEGILYRLMEHKRNAQKDYWTEAVIFTHPTTHSGQLRSVGLNIASLPWQ